MRLSRTDVIPVLVIIAGGLIGASLTLSPLVLWSPSDDVAAPEPEVSVDATLSGKVTRVGREVSPLDEHFMMLRFEDVEIVEIMAGPENARTGWSSPTRRVQ